MKPLSIKISHVTKTFNAVTAVKALSFEVETAQCFGLLGPNGAGKSTMMNMIFGKTRRDRHGGGGINVFGYDPEDHGLEIRFLSGIVPQDNNLDNELSVLQNLMVYSRFYGLAKQTALSRIDYLLDFMELTEKKDAKIRVLSGGMQRRLVIARALINSPKLLILDEPTTGLDPQVRQLIWEKLRMLKQEGVTILLSTHYMDEAFQICDNLIIMHKGEKMMEGNPGSLIRTHMEPWVLEVLDTETIETMVLPPAVRMEKTYSRVLLYSDDLDALTRIRSQLQAGGSFLRQSNLEDLFLKTTGRHLNE